MIKSLINILNFKMYSFNQEKIGPKIVQVLKEYQLLIILIKLY